MNRFDPKRPCPKCGRDRVQTRHVEAHCPGAKDRMERLCTGCGYRWNEEPLDANPEAT